jgi:hypothetical protein
MFCSLLWWNRQEEVGENGREQDEDIVFVFEVTLSATSKKTGRTCVKPTTISTTNTQRQTII